MANLSDMTTGYWQGGGTPLSPAQPDPTGGYATGYYRPPTPLAQVPQMPVMQPAPQPISSPIQQPAPMQPPSMQMPQQPTMQTPQPMQSLPNMTTGNYTKPQPLQQSTNYGQQDYSSGSLADLARSYYGNFGLKGGL